MNTMGNLSYAHTQTRQDIFRTRIKKKDLFVWGLVAFVFLYSVIPSSLVPIVSLPPFYSNVLSLLLVLCGLLCFLRNLFFSRLSLVQIWSLLVIPLLFIAFVGILTNDTLKGFTSFLSLIWPIAIVIGIPSLCFSIGEYLKRYFTHILFFLATAITVIVIVYGVGSVLAPRLGLRGGELTNWNEARLKGPLGNSAILYIVFLPTVGYWASRLRKGNKFARWGLLINVLGIIMTFSRAAIFSLLLWAAWLIFASKKLSRRNKLIIIIILLIIVGSISLGVWATELIDRLTSLEDSGRSNSLQAALGAFFDSPVWGQGFSHIWPWWQRQGELVAGLRENRWDGLNVYTKYGPSLWNPHSFISLFAAETGVIGLFLASSLFALPLGIALIHKSSSEIFSAVLIAFGVDMVLGGSFYAFPSLTLVWWIYMVSLLFYDTAHGKESPPTPARCSLGEPIQENARDEYHPRLCLGDDELRQSEEPCTMEYRCGDHGV